MTVKPLDDVRQISALTYGFIASKALFAALDLDLFSRISGGTDDSRRAQPVPPVSHPIACARCSLR